VYNTFCLETASAVPQHNAFTYCMTRGVSMSLQWNHLASTGTETTAAFERSRD